jgi:hypothetical protein
MDWNVFVSSFLGGSAALGLAGILAKSWVEHRFSIDRSRLQEERQLAQKRREMSAATAEILGEWVKSTYTGEFTDQDRWRLQTTYWKHVLWLDKELLALLIPAIARQHGAASTNELVVQTRKVVLGLSEPDIIADQLNNWPPQHHRES